MHLVHDIHPLPDLRGGIHRVIPQVPDVVHAIVGGGINFQHIHTAAGIDGPAGLAPVAGVAPLRMQAVHSLGQDFGAAGLAGAPGAGEEIGVAQLPGDDLGLQGLGHRQLAGHIVKGLGAVFPI